MCYAIKTVTGHSGKWHAPIHEIQPGCSRTSSMKKHFQGKGFHMDCNHIPHLLSTAVLDYAEFSMILCATAVTLKKAWALCAVVGIKEINRVFTTALHYIRNSLIINICKN